MSTDSNSGWRAGFKADQRTTFIEEWSPFVGAMLPLAIIGLMLSGTFRVGSLLGGLIFGIGMVFVGGCASGSLWRMGEGHLKLWVTMFFFSWMGSIAGAVFGKLDLTTIDETNVENFEMTRVGFPADLPEMWGSWGWTLAVGGALLLLWYALARCNESTEKFTLP